MNLNFEDLLQKQEKIAKLRDEAKKLANEIHAEISQAAAVTIDNLYRIKNDDFGTVHLMDRGYKLSITTPKTVEWDNEKLAELWRDIEEEAGDPEEYIDRNVIYSIPEDRYKNFHGMIKDFFTPARTTKPGKRVYEITKMESE